MKQLLNRMLRRLLHRVAQILPGLKRWIKTKPFLASLAFDFWNVGYFGRFSIHEKMLSDRLRIENYYHAISRHVHPGDVVVDLGTGSGILAFLPRRDMR